MPKFVVLSRRDAFIDYVAEVEASNAQAAVNFAYEAGPELKWEKRGVVEFDARRVVALDENGVQIESTARGDFS